MSGSVPPPACGGLCRLKPAFQAGGPPGLPQDPAFRGEGFQFPVQRFLFRPQAVCVQGTEEPVRVPLRGGKAARPDGGQRGLDVEQALPDLRVPLRDHAQPGFDGVLDVICTDLGRVLAGISGRQVLAGDGRVAKRVPLERSRRVVRRRSASAGEIGVGEARRRAVPLPAGRDAGAVSPRGLRERRLAFLSGRCGSGAPGRRDQEAEDQSRRRLKP